MIPARALRANSPHGSEVPACPRRCFAFTRLPSPFPSRPRSNDIFTLRSLSLHSFATDRAGRRPGARERFLLRVGRGHHRGRPIVGGHAVVVGGVVRWAAVMRGRIVRTTGNAGAQQQGKSQNSGHFAIVSGTKGSRTVIRQRAESLPGKRVARRHRARSCRALSIA